MFHGTLNILTLLISFYFSVKRKNKVSFLKKAILTSVVHRTICSTKKEMMLWTLGCSPGEGIEIDRGVPRNFLNCASFGKGKENAVYRRQRYCALQPKLAGTKLSRWPFMDEFK